MLKFETVYMMNLHHVPKVKIWVGGDNFDFSTFQICSPGRKGHLISPHPYPPSPTEVLSLLCWDNASMTEVGISLCKETARAFSLSWNNFAVAFGSQNHPTFVFQVRNEIQQCLFFVCFWNVLFGRYRVSFHFPHCPCIRILQVTHLLLRQGCSSWKMIRHFRLEKMVNFPASWRIFFPSLSLALLLLQYCQKGLNPRDLLK